MNGMYMDPPPAWLDTSSFLTCHSYIDRKQKQQINKVSSRDHEHPITRHLECDHLMSSSSAFTFFWPSDEIICLRFDSTNETSKFQPKTQTRTVFLSLSKKLSFSVSPYFSSVFSFFKLWFGVYRRKGRHRYFLF